MFLKTLRNRRSAIQFSLTLLLSSVGVLAHGQTTYSLTNNQFTITGSGASAGFSQTGTITDDTGTISNIANVPSTNGVGVPSFAFTLSSNFPGAAESASFKVAVIIEDQAHTNRRMEAEIGTLNLSWIDANTLKGDIPGTQSLKVIGQDGGGTTKFTVTNAANTAANGPITIASAGTSSTISFNGANLISRIRAANTAFDTILLPEFDQPATYNYWVVIQQTTGTAVQFGRKANSGVSFTQFTGQAAPSTYMKLLSPAYTAGAYSPVSVHGTFNVVFSSGSTTTATDTTAVTSGTTSLTTTNTALTTALSGTAPVTQETLNSVNNAVSSGSTLAQNTAATIATLTSTQAIDAFTQINTALDLAGQAVAKNAAPDISSAVSTITNLASALTALNTSGKLTLADDIAKVNTVATNTLVSATKLIGANATTANILAITEASSNILAQAAKATGSVVSDEVKTQVLTLANKAIDGLLKNLPTSTTGGVTVSNETAVQNLMKSNPSILQLALTASANLPVGTKIKVGGSEFSREELVALALGTSAQVSSISGGLNFSAATAGYTVTTDSTTGNMTLTNGVQKYVAASPASRLVPSTVPNGISYLPNGTAVLVGNGVATELAPTAFDKAGFSSAVTAAGFTLSYRSNGTISIALANSERFSAAFAYDDLGTAASCGVISITSPTGNPASASYAFTLKCANGPAQRITPITDNAKFYTSVAGAGLNANTDRNTGIVHIPTVGSFKPSFFVTPLSINDTAYYNANKNTDGIAFRAKDANGDGKTDYEVISSDGVQVLYGQ